MIKKFPKIYSFKSSDYKNGVYRGKIKLHGTNAAVAIADGNVIAQSRERILTPDNDNYGFSEWVNSVPEWRGLSNAVVFGEWCGEGIQNKAAITKIGKRIFAVFCIFDLDTKCFIYDPAKLEFILADVLRNKDIKVLPWETPEFLITPNKDITLLDNPENKSNAELSVDTINKLVDNCDLEDPWVKREYGISGPGEGFVFYPTYLEKESILEEGLSGELVSVDDGLPPYLFEKCLFKAKGKEHRGSKKAVSASKIDFTGIEDFLQNVLPECRLRQAIEEGCNRVISNEKIPDFLRWIVNDVKIECKDEIAAMNIPPTALMRAVTNKAIKWYRDLIN